MAGGIKQRHNAKDGAGKRKALLKSSSGIPATNPFQTDSSLPAREKAKLALGVILVPVKIALMIICIFLQTIIYRLSVIGVDPEKPLPAWRYRMQRYSSRFFGTILMGCFGIFWPKTKGSRAHGADCRMLVVAPHSTPMDALLSMCLMGAPTGVGKIELKHTLFGPMFTAGQTIFVDREDKNNRKQVADEIRDRISVSSPWRRQLALAPEGTCTNRTSLIQFKKGAFEPGAPVQPVLLRWEYKSFDPSWTAAAPNRGLVVIRSLCQFYQGVTVEYLPVYYPNEKEKKDPTLFAGNVRSLMAKTLGVPTSEFTYPDSFLAKEASKCKLRPDCVLPFTFHSFQEEMEPLGVKEDLFELSKTLLIRFSKAPGMSPRARMSQEQFSAVAADAAKDIGLDKPISWDEISKHSRGTDQTISFHAFLVTYLEKRYS
mmetsp:Transcript_1786/g.2685  ORF Transcript_1786/g.2685 Transcript_1786/m.2685 type:complete len:429 (+) Transcript_1786:213-1499(+)